MPPKQAKLDTDYVDWVQIEEIVRLYYTESKFNPIRKPFILSNNETGLEHSVLVFPNDNAKNTKIYAISRQKQSTFPNKEIVLGKGGQGEVKLCEDKNGNKFVIKIETRNRGYNGNLVAIMRETGFLIEPVIKKRDAVYSIQPNDRKVLAIDIGSAIELKKEGSQAVARCYTASYAAPETLSMPIGVVSKKVMFTLFGSCLKKI